MPRDEHLDDWHTPARRARVARYNGALPEAQRRRRRQQYRRWWAYVALGSTLLANTVRKRLSSSRLRGRP